MDERGNYGLKLVFCVLESVAMLSVCCPRLLCVWTRPSAFILLQCLYGVISIKGHSMSNQHKNVATVTDLDETWYLHSAY